MQLGKTDMAIGNFKLKHLQKDEFRGICSQTSADSHIEMSDICTNKALQELNCLQTDVCNFM